MEFVVLYHLNRMLVFEVRIFTCEIYQVFHLNWELVLHSENNKLAEVVDFPKQEYGHRSQSKLDKGGGVYTH